jgi:hypothetical protein
MSNPPNTEIVEHPVCTYNVVWKHPAFCLPKFTGTSCPTPAVPPPAAPVLCTTCLPTWTPSYEMKRSTILYTCNASGMHDVGHAIKFAVSDSSSIFAPLSF